MILKNKYRRPVKESRKIASQKKFLKRCRRLTEDNEFNEENYEKFNIFFKQWCKKYGVDPKKFLQSIIDGFEDNKIEIPDKLKPMPAYDDFISKDMNHRRLTENEESVSDKLDNFDKPFRQNVTSKYGLYDASVNDAWGGGRLSVEEAISEGSEMIYGKADPLWCVKKDLYYFGFDVVDVIEEVEGTLTIICKDANDNTRYFVLSPTDEE